MTKKRTIKVADGRKFGTTVARQLETVEVGIGVGPSRDPAAGVELWLPANGRDVPGFGGGRNVPGLARIRIFHPGRAADLEAQGVDEHEARRRTEMSAPEIAAFNLAVLAGDPGDDVGDEPPRSTQESATARESGSSPDGGRA